MSDKSKASESTICCHAADESDISWRRKPLAPKKHACPDCHFCQWCSDDRCRLCRECRTAGGRKLSLAEQIALYEEVNAGKNSDKL